MPSYLPVGRKMTINIKNKRRVSFSFSNQSTKMTNCTVNDYEARIVKEIAEWKARKPGLFTRVTTTLTRPFAWAMRRIIPEVAARKAIEAAYATSDWLATSDVFQEGDGVKTLAELQSKSLELCDRLASRHATRFEAMAAADGAVMGFGGFALAAADVGALAVLALRAIQYTAHCYGYALDQPQDRTWVLGILMVVGTKSRTEKLDLLGRLQNVETWVLAESTEAIAMERLSVYFLELASLDSVPGIGAVIGTGTNLFFIRQVLHAAKCICQERWLRSNNKVESILPAF